MEYSDLLFPTLEVKNKRGEIVFSMKKKGEKYGQLYYIFEWHWDRVDSEMLGKVSTTWELIKSIAGLMGIPLYDLNDVLKGVEKEKEKIPLGKTRDISIPILDHATGSVNNLVIAVAKQEMKLRGGEARTNPLGS